ncbi:methyl-accepting chemotaxis protein [Iodobacter fluviatilis]|uniref:Methyl-accepting chemotaxis protein mcpC n=1 Tax=Iodobacter fluviatilis TaxID=537 RepID=A0A377STS7_9NEIS|nr:methyl-accepting chemotaxis protein [Iodobacter fluviatilis]TCU86277.1 twitching motility protein PilJ [Iodobacter fluviatilis]STR44688.1 Methyl-accepting chemotaxis protein mcpC [Iodobacter fluviatilis]
MALNLDGVKRLFSGRKQAAPVSANTTYEPIKTTWIMGKLSLPEADESQLKKPLPLIGLLPIRQQMAILLAVMLLSAGLFIITAFLAFQASSYNAERRAVSTEMQMLSQRIARASTQAVQGKAEAFPILKDAYIRFDDNLKQLSGGGLLASLLAHNPTQLINSVNAIWKKSFSSNAARPTVDTILKQEKALVTIGQSVLTINRNDAILLENTQEFAKMLGANGGSARDLEYAQHLSMLSQRMAKNSNTVFGDDLINPEVVSLLGKDSVLFDEIITAFLDGQNPDLQIRAVSNPALIEKLKEIDKRFRDFEVVITSFSKNMQPLVSSRLASQSIVTDSEKLLKDTGDLADAYENKTGSFVTGFLEFIFVVVALFALYQLVSVFNQESVRRRLVLEAENKKNQEAILRLLNEMADLADGDLTVRASVTEDLTGAIADSINYTIEELRSLITKINRATGQVTSATQEAQGISDELLAAAERQSVEIEGTNQTVEQMVTSIRGVSSNAAESANVAQSSLMAAEKGAEAVQNQIKGMGDIREQIQETAKRIKRLGESSQEISEIVELISDITEQTNVLALNAAIQAAAAGDAGRGFSIVAEEVQRLAERSGEATKQISAIVKTIQTDTHDAVAAMEVSTQGVVEGAKLSDAAGQALTEIGQVSRDLARLIESIAHETEDQTQLASKVNLSMRDILAITEQTTAGTKQSAIAVGQLTSLAQELKDSASGFKL